MFNRQYILMRRLFARLFPPAMRWSVSLLVLAAVPRAEAHNGKAALAAPVPELTIDGDLSDWPDHLTTHAVDLLRGGRKPTDPSDFQGAFRAGYSVAANALYIAVEVRDESLMLDEPAESRRYRRYSRDGCEIHLDLTHGADDSAAVQYVLRGKLQERRDPSGPLPDWRHAEVAAAPTDGGRVYEWRIDVGAMTAGQLQLGPGIAIGFDVVLSDRDADNSRSRLQWGEGTRKVYSPERRGDLLLVREDVALGRLQGRVVWTDAALRSPPQKVQIQSLDAPAAWRIATDADGVFATEVPAGTYSLRAVDYRADSAASVLSTATVQPDNKRVVQPLLVTYSSPAERHRSNLAILRQRKQRGVSLEAGTQPVSPDYFIPLARDNVTWIVQTPFGRQRQYNSPEVGLRPDAGWWGESDVGVAATAHMAREFGIKTLLKPHVWLRRSNEGKWRGDIAMDDEASWQKWFASYEEFILHYAHLAEANDIEALCIGTELYRAAVEREADWRRLIAAVRQVYGGELTYAANWYREFEEIRFWDALDYIGIQSYFPLAAGDSPSVAALKESWKPHLAAIEAVQQRYGKPVIFTEVGYHSTVDAAAEPWEWDPTDAEVPATGAGLQTQANCYDAFFQTFWQRDWVAGAYFWKWHADHAASGGPHNRNFTPQNKPAEETMATWYGKTP